MPQSVLLIAGRSSGIGLSTSVVAGKHGYRVVATMRNLDGAGPLRAAADEAGVELDVRRLDVTDQASITTCVDGVVADHGHLDVVVNNAGAGHIGTIENESLDDVRQVMEVNFFGVVAVTEAVIPHLRASHGRIVTVTSVGGAVGQPFNEAYCAAKFAVEGFMESMAPVAESLGVGVALVVADRAPGRRGDDARHPARLPRLPLPDVALGPRVRRAQARRLPQCQCRGPDQRLAALTSGRPASCRSPRRWHRCCR
jgi:NAD(P)-dependent dehydrogenase (short-subunit alcohol dehydrogenase family)